MKRTTFNDFGGVNVNDTSERLMRRLQQVGMVEAPISVNTEYYPNGMGRRKGHSAHEFSAAIANALITDDEVLAVGSFIEYTEGRKVTVVVGKLSAYANPFQSESFHQLYKGIVASYSNNNTTLTATLYAHTATYQVADILEFDNRAIFTGGFGRMQVYSVNHDFNINKPPGSGLISNPIGRYVLDGQIGGDYSGATASVNGVSLGAFSVDNASVFRPYDYVIDNNGLINTVKEVIGSVVRCYVTNTSASAATYIKPYNRYTEFYGRINSSQNTFSSTAIVYTGLWNANYTYLSEIHGRILYGSGDNVVEYSPNKYAAASGVWDASAGGFFTTESPIRAIRQFVPEGGGDMNAHIYMFTDKGVASRPGMADFDEVILNNSNNPILNQMCVTQIENWLVYLTRDKQLRAVNGRFDIDLGRRLKSRDGSSGPLDAMDTVASEGKAFLHYDSRKKKLYAHFSSATGLVNDRIAVLDFELGEPVLGEPLESFEARVRCLDWRIDSPTANPGFVAMQSTDTDTVGFKADGTAWKINDGDVDFGANKIAASWYGPQLTQGQPAIEKHWYEARMALQNSGPHSLQMVYRPNRETSEVALSTFAVSDADGIVLNSEQINLHKYAMQIGVKNENSLSAEPWVLTGVSVEHTLDALEY